MEYLTFKVDDVAAELQLDYQSPERRAFGNMLEKVAKALYAIEWVDSGDWGTGDDTRAIMEALEMGGGINAVIAEQNRLLLEQLEILEKLKAKRDE